MLAAVRGLPIIALAAGCYAPDIGAGGACETVCPGDLLCIEGVCVDTAGGDDPSLAAHWRFDDDPDDGALDSSGRGHDAACTTCPRLVVGKLGGGYLFDDSDEEILVVPDHPDFRGPYTIAAWIYADSLHDQIALLSKPFGSDTGNSWQLEVLEDDLVSLSGGSPHSLRSPDAIPTEEWHHLAGTWDGATKRLFFDGALVAETDAGVEYDDHAIYLGGDQNNGAEALHWDGVLDDLRIYGRVLPGDELAVLAR
jgi:hypothetical protein